MRKGVVACLKKRTLIMVICLFFTCLVFAVNFEIGFQGFYDFEEFNDRIGVKIYHLAPNFDFVADIGFTVMINTVSTNQTTISIITF